MLSPFTVGIIVYLWGGRLIKNPTFIELNYPYDGTQIHRNFQCLEYNDCLTNAAFQNLDLHCCDCPLRDSKQTPHQSHNWKFLDVIL